MVGGAPARTNRAADDGLFGGAATPSSHDDRNDSGGDDSPTVSRPDDDFGETVAIPASAIVIILRI